MAGWYTYSSQRLSLTSSNHGFLLSLAKFPPAAARQVCAPDL